MKLPEMYLGDIESGLTGPYFRRRVQVNERERATINFFKFSIGQVFP